MRKKSGVVLIEASITLMIILAIFSASAKIFTRNLEKSKYLYSREDIRSLAYLEYEFLLEFNKFVAENKEVYLQRKEKGIEGSLDFNIYEKDGFENYAITIKNKKFYITHKGNKSKKYIGLDEINADNKILFKPNTYKTDYILISS